MSKLFIETLDGGARVTVSVAIPCDADAETRFHVPRPSSRPPAPPDDDIPTVRRTMLHPPRVPRFDR